MVYHVFIVVLGTFPLGYFSFLILTPFTMHCTQGTLEDLDHQS